MPAPLLARSIKIPQMAAAGVSVPRESPSCLLPLWECLQEQQEVCQTTCFVKELLLNWDSEHVRFCAWPLRAESVPYSLPAQLNNKPHWFPSQASWGLIFTVVDPWAEEPDVKWRPLHSSGRASVAVISLLFVGRWPRGDQTRPSFLHPSCLSHGGSFYLRWWKMFFSGLQVVLIGSHPISSCSFGVPVGGGEPRVFFLLYYLNLSPLPISGCSSWDIVKVKKKNQKQLKDWACTRM